MKFSLVKGDIDEFAILDDKLPDNLDKLLVDNSIRAKIDVKEKILALVNTVKYISHDKDLLKIRSILYFKIEESSWNEINKNNKIIIEKKYLQHMGIIIIGATRGMLIAKCNNTVFSKLILPQIKISDLLFEDIIFDIDHG